MNHLFKLKPLGHNHILPVVPLSCSPARAAGGRGWLRLAGGRGARRLRQRRQRRQRRRRLRQRRRGRSTAVD